MEKVRVKRGSSEVIINPIFYNKECILRTKKIFSKFAKISVRERENEIVVTLKPKIKIKPRKLDTNSVIIY